MNPNTPESLMSTQPNNVARAPLGVGVVALVWSLLACAFFVKAGVALWHLTGWTWTLPPDTPTPPPTVNPLAVGLIIVAGATLVSAGLAVVFRERAYALVAAALSILPFLASLIGPEPLLILLGLPLSVAPTALWVVAGNAWQAHGLRERARRRYRSKSPLAIG